MMFSRTPPQFSDLIVVRVDGGVCSQIAFAALGLELSAKGYRVKYDLSWFHDCGKDLTGRFVRNWDIQKAFPGLKFEEASSDEIAYLKRHCRRRGENVNSFRPPLYIDGYPERNQALVTQLPKLRSLFRPREDDGMRAVLPGISDKNSCAVHVRRGDLAIGNAYYGSATSIDYYRRAMAYVAALHPGTAFYFFSDEPQWVRTELLSQIPTGCMGFVVDSNGSDRGYVDLYLISQCRRVISSIGSLGWMGALLAPENELLVMANRRNWISDVLPHVCYLNDDRGSVYEGAGTGDRLLSAIPEDRLRGFGWFLFRIWRKLGLWLCRNSVAIAIPQCELSKC